MKKRTKGERLNWKPLNKIEKIDLKLVSCKLISTEELNLRRVGNSNFIVP